MRRYEKPDVSPAVEAWEESQAAAEAEHAAKPLAQRKAEYWAFCESFGITDDVIATNWNRYLETGEM